MQLLQLTLCLSVIIFNTQCSNSTSIIDSNDNAPSFLYEAKQLVSFVRSDIKQLEMEAGDFDPAMMRENMFKVVEHFKNTSKRLQQIEMQHVKKSEKGLYLNYNARNDDIIGFEVNLKLLLVNNSFYNFEHMTKIDLHTAEVLSRPPIAFVNSINEFYVALHGLKCNDTFGVLSSINKLRELHKFPMHLRCSRQQSPQQYFYSLTKEIALGELRAYIQIEYSIMIQRLWGQNGNFTTETNTVRHNYDEITKKALNSLRNVAEKADRLLWRCDPKQHVHNVTYDVVTRLLQGTVENEVNREVEAACSRTCPDYQNTTRTGCIDQKLCSQPPRCLGRIHDCHYIGSDLSVCLSPENDTRRYERIRYTDFDRLGERICFDTDSERWNKCSYCFCLCDEPGPKSDRYFNLRATLSDVEANKVVTGVRFVKKNRIFHLQIQQGQLLPRGAINESTVDWVPVDDYKIDDAHVKEGIDYHTLSYERRAIDLNNVTMNSDDGTRTFVVTGVRYQLLEGHLSLQVQFSQYDFIKGELVEPELNSTWQTNDKNYNRQKFSLNDMQLSIGSRVNTLYNTSGGYLEFGNTGLRRDAAQTTIPFVDIQDVAFYPPVPLAGISIYYKGRYGFGGFIAPQIISFDLSAQLAN